SLHSPVVIDGVVHLLSAVIVPLYDLCSCGCVGWVRKVASRPVITEHLEIGGRSLPAVDHYRDVVFRSGSAVARWGGEPAGERSHEELGEAERGEAAGGGRKAADEQQHDGGERQRCEDAEAETRGPEEAGGAPGRGDRGGRQGDQEPGPRPIQEAGSGNPAGENQECGGGVAGGQFAESQGGWGRQGGGEHGQMGRGTPLDGSRVEGGRRQEGAGPMVQRGDLGLEGGEERPRVAKAVDGIGSQGALQHVDDGSWDAALLPKARNGRVDLLRKAVVRVGGSKGAPPGEEAVRDGAEAEDVAGRGQHVATAQLFRRGEGRGERTDGSDLRLRKRPLGIDQTLGNPEIEYLDGG